MLKLWPALAVSIVIISYGEIYLTGNYSLYHIVGLLVIWIFNVWYIQFKYVNYSDNKLIDMDYDNDDKFNLLASEIAKTSELIMNEHGYFEDNIESLKKMVSDASAELYIDFTSLSESIEKQKNNIEHLVDIKNHSFIDRKDNNISVDIDVENALVDSMSNIFSEINKCNIDINKNINNMICILQFEDVVKQLCFHASERVCLVTELLSEVNNKLIKYDGTQINLTVCMDAISEFNKSMNLIEKNNNNLNFNSGLRNSTDKNEIELF